MNSSSGNSPAGTKPFESDSSEERSSDLVTGDQTLRSANESATSGVEVGSAPELIGQGLEGGQWDAPHGNLEPLPSAVTNEPIIRVRNLTKSFRVGEVQVHALQGVDLDVRRGEFLAMIGTSGSGKSTLFNILGGLTPPSTGSVAINGRDLSHMSDAQRNDLRKRTVGFVFQKYNLLPTLTAEQNIQIVRNVAGRPIHFDQQFREILEMLGISHRMTHKPRALSGGEQQRVAIARAIVNGPAILLADEPTGNLDSKNSEIVLTLLRDLNKKLGQTILMITHDPDAAAYADRVVRMRDGKIV